MRGHQWARLKPGVEAKIRRGAWYRVLRLGSAEAVLEVNRQPTPVPRALLTFAANPPLAWAIVPRSAHSPRLPENWGDTYLVCPACRERAQLLDSRPATQRCSRCNGLFEIHWDEVELQSA